MFAVLLQGEGEGRARLEELGRRVHAVIGRALAPVYQPHLSLGLFKGDGRTATDLAETFAKTVAPLGVRIEGIGVFPATPGVVYAAPVATNALLTVHAAFVRAFATAGEGLHPYYRLDAWVAHATLVTPATASEQGDVTAALAPAWQPFDFRLTALAVVRVPDGQSLAQFPLSG